MLATSLTNAYELFYAANQVIKRENNSALSKAELVKVSTQLGSITLPSGLSFTADAVINDDIYDMVYIPALWRNPRPVVHNNKEVVEWIRTINPQPRTGITLNSSHATTLAHNLKGNISLPTRGKFTVQQASTP